MPCGTLGGMNHSNRLETESWSPSWDLGLQDEFGFAQEVDTDAKSEEAASTRWSQATREVFNRQQRSFDRRVCYDGTSIGDLIAYFEATCSVEGADHGQA